MPKFKMSPDIWPHRIGSSSRVEVITKALYAVFNPLKQEAFWYFGCWKTKAVASAKV